MINSIFELDMLCKELGDVGIGTSERCERPEAWFSLNSSTVGIDISPADIRGADSSGCDDELDEIQYLPPLLVRTICKEVAKMNIWSRAKSDGTLKMQDFWSKD